MVVYAISDLHGNLPPIPEDAELLLIGGDICPDFRPYGHKRHQHWGFGIDTGGTQQARWLDTDFRKWLESAPCPVVGIAGNHDFVFEHIGLVPHLPWTYLQDQEAPQEAAGGLRVWGTPWVPHLQSWAFYGREEQLMLRAELIPKGLDVLLTHGPPYGAGDYIPGGSKYGNIGAENVGDSSLVPIIAARRPKVTVCGHIHEARGRSVVYAPMAVPNEVVNVVAVNEVYELRERPYTRLHEFD
jgi:Icc-related predicted phosphoesterase